MAGAKTAVKGFNKSAEAESVAGTLPDIDLEARKLAGIIQGLRDRNVVGRGSQFHSFEHFRNGYDDPSRIDWRSSARLTDREGNEMHVIRQREREVTQMLYLWRDGSESMNFKAPKALFPEQPPFTKKQAAEILLLATAYLAARSSERFTLLGSDLRMSGNRHGVDRILQELGMDDAGSQDLPKLPSHRGKPLGKNSHVFIFSDFLSPIEEIRAMIKSMHTAGIKVHLVQILDPAEIEFRYKKHVRFKDMEGAFSHTMKKAESAKSEVEQIVQNHIRQVAEMVRRVPGWSFTTYVTDQPLTHALLPLYGIKPNRAPAPKPV